jgi:hypothetical protein
MMKKAKSDPKYLYLLLMGILISANAGGNDNAVATDDKPYQIIDGNIDKNTFEGWKTYLAESTVVKNDKEMFKNYVINGYPGTLMKPHRNDERVMENLDNLYSYLKARADGVLGPENLIKYQLGKNE